MGIETLLGHATDEQLKKLPGRVRSPERVKQHLDAFALHLQGVSYRGIQSHFGWKSLSTAENSVRRGEMLAKDLNLDSEKIRLKLAAFFDEILDISLNQIREQVKEGQLTLITDSDGNQTITKRRGVDTRLLGEAGRGAIRFAQFCGLMDSDKSTATGGEVSTNVVFVNATDASEWDAKTVDVPAMPTELDRPVQIPADSGISHSLRADDSGSEPAQSADSKPAVIERI